MQERKVGERLKRHIFVDTAKLRITVRLKEIKKRRALIGKQRVEHLTNSAGKRTDVVLNPSFFYFFNPSYVIGHFRTDHKQTANGNLEQ